ncbi:MAG: hypothetical protein RBT41_05270 [Clostridia bacterium]|jgi:hypothetical protein|nr:hypothetical protein [Clostridia bacterium]
MQAEYFRVAARCPLFESIRNARGIDVGSVPSRDLTPRCNHCSFWAGGSCELFLSKGKN